MEQLIAEPVVEAASIEFVAFEEFIAAFTASTSMVATEEPKSSAPFVVVAAEQNLQSC